MTTLEILQDFRKRLAQRAGHTGSETLLAVMDSLDETIDSASKMEALEQYERGEQ